MCISSTTTRCISNMCISSTTTRCISTMCHECGGRSIAIFFFGPDVSERDFRKQRPRLDEYRKQDAEFEEVMAGFDDSDINVVHEEEDPDSAALNREAEEAPVVKLVNLILSDAVKKREDKNHCLLYAS